MKAATQMLSAREGTVTREIREVAAQEGVDPESLQRDVAAGRVVIPCNPAHEGLRPIGIGRSLRTKVNVNIGNSSLASGLEAEREKLRTALRHGADTVMDLSTGADIRAVRQAILDESPVPVGTVPIYEAMARPDDPAAFSPDDLFDVIRAQAEQGVDYMTLHAGLLRAHVPLAKRRVVGIVSRGGSILAAWMMRHGRENPLHERFDEVLEICRRHDVTISLGDGLRPGCLADASDEAQFAELSALGDLVRRCRAAGVQAMVEGPGHVPLHEVAMNMERERAACGDAPFYVLGPVVADCAPGYDHITAAIGGAVAALHGAAMLCYVTPKEHLALPDAEDVRNGLVAFRIAAHAADVALGRPGARDRDDAISRARAAFDWEGQFRHALDPDRAREFRAAALREGERRGCLRAGAGPEDFCTMCGPRFCALRISRDIQGAGGGADGAAAP